MRRGGEQTQASAQIAGAGADFERAVGWIDPQRLQDASLYVGRKHRLTETDGNRRVGERELAVAFGHERFARHRAERIEHAPVENLPGADLLIHHLLSSGDCIHRVPWR